MGLPKSGKTYNAARMVDRAPRLLVWDAMHCFNGQPGPRSNFLPNCVVISSLPYLVAYLRAHRNGPFRVIYQPGYALEKEFDYVSKLVIEIRNLVFFVDEVWQVCKPAWMPPALNLISRAWGHRGITMIYTAQRPQVVAADLRENTTNWELFHMEGDRALEAIRGRVPDAVISQLPSLPPRWHITATAGEWRLIKP